MKTILEVLIQYPLVNLAVCIFISIFVSYLVYQYFQEKRIKYDTYRLLEKYKVQIERFCYPEKSPAQLSMEAYTTDNWSGLPHTYWMILVCLEKKHNIRKLNRWIGFIQHSMFFNGLATQSQLRSDSRNL